MNHMTSILRVSRSRTLMLLGVAGLAVALSVPLPFISGVRNTSASNSLFFTTGQTSSAYASTFDPTSGIGADVGVSQSGSTSNPQAWLSYDVYQIDSMGNYTLLDGGDGPIPNTSLQVKGGARPSTATLTIDTGTAIPGFTIAAGSGGVISVSWNAISTYWSTSNGSYQDHVGRDIVFQGGGSHYYTGASAQGKVLNISLQGPTGIYSYGELDSSQGMTVCRACSP